MKNILPLEPTHIYVLRASRDPNQKDTNFPLTLWISQEYTPWRVFEGEKGVWRFIGKLYPDPAC